jgi:hypothetical protein
VSAAANQLPQADIVLVNITGSNTLNGTFDSMNGGSAEEGTLITLAGNTYSLTYQYAAEGTTANDIALVFQGGAADQPAYNPVPGNGANVDIALALLQWTNPLPEIAGNPVYCDVYLGTAADRLSMDKITLANDISEIEINTTNFPNFGNLQNQTQYYWMVDVHDGENLRSGQIWSFTVHHYEAPNVDAGEDQVVWLGKSGTMGQETITLNGTISNEGAYTVLWTQVNNGAPNITITPNDVDDTSVTVNLRGTYEFMLTADNGVMQTSDTVQIIAGETSCDASHMSTGQAYDASDYNQDCMVDFGDFAIFAADGWLECTDAFTNCGY